MALTEVNIKRFAPRFSIDINNSRLAAEVSHTILSVEVVQEINKTNSFSFQVQDEFLTGKFRWLGHDLFKYGNTVSISMGYAEGLVKLVEGKIQNISANFMQGTAPTFTVEGSDNAYEFLKVPSDTEVFRDKTDSDIVKVVAEKAHMDAVVDDTDEVFPTKIKKGGESYLDFLKDLAAGNHYEFSLSGRQLKFIRAKGDAAPRTTFTWGIDLLSFNPRLNTTQAVSEVVVRAWDSDGKKLIEARASAGEEQRQEEGRRLASQVAREIYGDVVRVITDRPVQSVSEARQEARRALEQASDDFIRGTAEVIGIPELRPGLCIRLDGVGSWFSGKYYIEKASHRIDQNGFRSSLELRRNAV